MDTKIIIAGKLNWITHPEIDLYVLFQKLLGHYLPDIEKLEMKSIVSMCLDQMAKFRNERARSEHLYATQGLLELFPHDFSLLGAKSSDETPFG